jgi:thymidylate kinase
MEKPKVISIGFEGPNRSGKGTQIEILSNQLENMGIPYLVVRGDGSRPNQGEHKGDPVSEWWSKTIPLLKDPENKDSDLWNDSSARLARELIVFRDRVLPNIAKQNNKPVAVLLVDRTLLSRTMVPRSQEKKNISDNLYSQDSGIDTSKICPDLIFNIVVDKETLLSRLDEKDPKYEFRKKLILEKYNWYLDAHKYIPEGLQDRIIQIDGSSDPITINNSIIEIINKKFPEIKK